MKEGRVEKILNIIKEMDLDACALQGMENIFYLTGFRGSEGILVITKGDVFSMYAKSTASKKWVLTASI